MMRLFEILILFSYLIACVSCRLEYKHFQNNYTFNLDLPEAICHVVNKIFAPKHSSFNLVTAIEDENDPKVGDLKSKFFECHADLNLARQENHYEIQKMSANRQRYLSVILLDKYSSFRVLNKSLNDDLFKIRGFYLFVFLNGKFKEYEKLKLTLFNQMLARSAFLYENSDTKTLQFEKLVIYSHDYCGGSKSVKVVEFKDGKFSKEKFEIFTNDFDNLHGCEMKVPTFHRPPALIIDKHTNQISGFDWTILNLLAGRLNFRVREMRLYGSNKWGAFDDKTGRFTEALRELHEGVDVKLVIGNYILRLNRLQYFDISNTYFVTPMVLVIPFGDEYTSIEKLVKPFDVTIWSIMIMMFLVSLMTIFIINWKFEQVKDFVYGIKIRSPVINILIAIFGGSQKRLPTKNFARFLLMMFLIFCLVQRNVYQGIFLNLLYRISICKIFLYLGLLFIFMTKTQRHPEIKSLNDVYNESYTFSMYPAYSGTIPGIERFENPFHSYIYEKICFPYSKEKLIKDTDTNFDGPMEDKSRNLFLTTGIDIMTRNREYSKEGFFLNICNEPVITVNIVILLKKNIWLQSTINEALDLLQSSGLVQYAINQHVDQKYFKMREQIAERQKLKIQQFSGIFRIWLIGLLISFLIFIIEHLIYRVFKSCSG